MAKKKVHYASEEERKKAQTRGLIPFKKGDPRINKNGRPKAIPKLGKLIAEVLGGYLDDGTDSGAHKVLKNIFDQATRKDNPNAVRAASLLLDKAYGKDPIIVQSTSDVTSGGKPINQIDMAKIDNDTLEKIIASLKKEE